jgi:hypothetical protein
MKDLLKYLPHALKILPVLAKYFKYIMTLILVSAILAVLGGVGWYFMTNYKDLYVCHDNQLYEQVSFNSNVYTFKGTHCVDTTK